MNTSELREHPRFPKKLGHQICAMPRSWKRRILIALDFGCLVFALWAAYALRLNDPWPEAHLINSIPLFIVLPFIGVLILTWLGVYRTLLRSLERRTAMRVIRGVAAIALILVCASFLMPPLEVPRSVPIIFALTLAAALLGVRLGAQSFFQAVRRNGGQASKVAIYGAGSAGQQLLAAIDAGQDYDVVGFVDDDKALRGHRVAGRSVYQPEDLPTLASRYGITQILLALPSISISRRREILVYLSQMGMRVLTVPSVAEIVGNRVDIDTLRGVSLDDLLGRDQVDPHLDLLSAAVTGQAVMVTGAGGSIGSELCRQIITLQPKRVVLFERSEHALYEIERELRDILSLAKRSIEVEPVLGSICDASHLARTFDRYEIDTVYHAAAYKHVPMIESNVLQGLYNNVIGTDQVAREAGRAGLKRAILVSTDKAVRPTNVMGATKRWAEQIFQASQARYPETLYSMVRFGNVLGSSGSVIARFSQQIRQGGPVTVTHPEIYRYFMSIPEAAQLVIQAGALAEGGEVFLLEMGEPVRIVDLARHMIALHGLSVRDEKNPDGDIEIVYTGLRPGEKLYEELIIGGDPVATRHPRIMLGRESHLPSDELDIHLAQLKRAISAGEVAMAQTLLRKTVPEYAPRVEPLKPFASGKGAASRVPGGEGASCTATGGGTAIVNAPQFAADSKA